MKKKGILVVVAALLLTFCSPVLAASSTESVKYESEGYATSTEAASAYIEAFKAQDAQAMLSTFAIETLVDHINHVALIEQSTEYSLSDPGYIPYDNDYAKYLNIRYRVSEVTGYFRSAFLVFSAPELDCTESYIALTRLSGDTGDGFFEEWFTDLDWMEHTQFEYDFINPVKLGYSMSSMRNIDKLNKLAVCYGADEIQPLVAQLTLDGELYYQCMDVIRYDDRWYMFDFNRFSGDIMDISKYQAGLSKISVYNRKEESNQ